MTRFHNPEFIACGDECFAIFIGALNFIEEGKIAIYLLRFFPWRDGFTRVAWSTAIP